MTPRMLSPLCSRQRCRGIGGYVSQRVSPISSRRGSIGGHGVAGSERRGVHWEELVVLFERFESWGVHASMIIVFTCRSIITARVVPARRAVCARGHCHSSVSISRRTASSGSAVRERGCWLLLLKCRGQRLYGRAACSLVQRRRRVRMRHRKAFGRRQRRGYRRGCTRRCSSLGCRTLKAAGNGLYAGLHVNEDMDRLHSAVSAVHSTVQSALTVYALIQRTCLAYPLLYLCAVYPAVFIHLCMCRHAESCEALLCLADPSCLDSSTSSTLNVHFQRPPQVGAFQQAPPSDASSVEGGEVCTSGHSQLHDISSKQVLQRHCDTVNSSSFVWEAGLATARFDS